MRVISLTRTSLISLDFVLRTDCTLHDLSSTTWILRHFLPYRFRSPPRNVHLGNVETSSTRLLCLLLFVHLLSADSRYTLPFSVSHRSPFSTLRRFLLASFPALTYLDTNEDEGRERITWIGREERVASCGSCGFLREVGRNG